MFKMKDLNKSGAIVDVKKLDQLNGQHLQIWLDNNSHYNNSNDDGFWWANSSQQELHDYLLVQARRSLLKNNIISNNKFINSKYIDDDKYVISVLSLIKDRISLVKQVCDPIGLHFFQDLIDYSNKRC